MNLEMNCGPQSEMMTWGMLCHVYTWSRRIWAHPLAESSMLQATGMIALENQSTITRRASCPPEVGSPVIMSTEI